VDHGDERPVWLVVTRLVVESKETALISLYYLCSMFALNNIYDIIITISLQYIIILQCAYNTASVHISVPRATVPYLTAGTVGIVERRMLE
jgi:hypothetical protein